MMESSPPNPKAIEEVFNNEETPDNVREQDPDTPRQLTPVALDTVETFAPTSFNF